MTERERGDLTASLRTLEEAISADPSFAPAHTEWALSAEHAGTEPPTRVRTRYEEGALLAPDDARAQMLAAGWNARIGEVSGALAGYDRVLVLDPRSVDALCRKADLLLQHKRDATGALSAYQAAYAIDARSVPVLMGLADAGERAGAHVVAEDALRALVALFPDAAVYRSKLVAFLRRTGQQKKADAAEREIEKAAPRDTRKLRSLKRSKR